jgi:hypothetical protein
MLLMTIPPHQVVWLFHELDPMESLAEYICNCYTAITSFVRMGKTHKGDIQKVLQEMGGPQSRSGRGGDKNPCLCRESNPSRPFRSLVIR